MSDSSTLDRLRASARPAEARAPARAEDNTAGGDGAGAEAIDRAGLVGRSPPLGLVLEQADGRCETVLYAELCSTVRLWPDLGVVSFVFEADREVEPGRVEHARWHVCIYGTDLGALFAQLSAGVRQSVRVTGGRVTAITIHALAAGDGRGTQPSARREALPGAGSTSRQ